MSVDPDPDTWSPADSPSAIALSEAQWAIWTLDLLAGRLWSEDDPARQIDARLFVGTLRQLLYAAEMELDAMRAEVPASAVAAYTAAIEDYKAKIPGVVEIRNVLTHFANYAVGTGALQKPDVLSGMSRVDVARKFWGGGYNPATDTYTFGVYSVHIRSALAAAAQLRRDIYRAAKTIDHVQEQRSAQATSSPEPNDSKGLEAQPSTPAAL